MADQSQQRKSQILQHEAIRRHRATSLHVNQPQPGPRQQDPCTVNPAGPPPQFSINPHNLESVRVFFLAHVLRPAQLPRMLTDVPAICVNGDQYIRLQSGDAISIAYDDTQLLSHKERRLARKKVIASVNTLLAHGGYPSSVPVRPYPKVRCATLPNAVSSI